MPENLVVTTEIEHVPLLVEALEHDERTPAGKLLVGTYLLDDTKPRKLIARQVVDGIDDLLRLQAAVRDPSGVTVGAAVRFDEPGLVADLAVTVPGDVVYLGRIVRFKADFVAGGTDIEAEGAAFLEAVFGDAPVVEPIEKMIQHGGL